MLTCRQYSILIKCSVKPNNIEEIFILCLWSMVSYTSKMYLHHMKFRL